MEVDDDKPHRGPSCVVDVVSAAHMEDAASAEHAENVDYAGYAENVENAVSAVDGENTVDALHAMVAEVVTVEEAVEGSTRTRRNRTSPPLRAQNEAGKSLCSHHIQRS